MKLWNPKPGTVLSTLLGPQKEGNNKQTLSCGQNLFCIFPRQVCKLLLYYFRSRTKFSFTTAPLSSRSMRFKCHLVHGQAGAQNLANWVSVGIGWGIGGLASKASKHAKHSCTPKTAPKPCLKLMPCLHHLKMDYILGGPLPVLGGPRVPGRF